MVLEQANTKKNKDLEESNFILHKEISKDLVFLYVLIVISLIESTVLNILGS